jgi:pyruvate-formate lyase-activating enzyme
MTTRDVPIAALAIVDTSVLEEADDHSRKLLCITNWWQRIISFFDSAVYYGSITPPVTISRIKDIQEAFWVAQEHNADVIVYISCDQLFLDLEVVQNGLRKIKDIGQQWHYFSQWEHCRLPVGLGVRILNMNCKEMLQYKSKPLDFIKHVSRSAKFVHYYDDTPYTNYANSLLESRYSPNSPLKDVVLQKEIDSLAMGAQPLSIFMDLAQKQEKQTFYCTEENIGYCDERGMPSAIGFESVECAAFPTYIMFDITNICNSRCIHCPHSSIIRRKKTGATHLPWERFVEVADECAEKEISFIRITADGEPLLHPKLDKMLTYLTKKNIGPVGLTSNGSLLNADRGHRILETDIFLIDISLDAATAETYSIIRRGLDYNTVIKNIEYLLSLRDKINHQCKVMVSFVEQAANKHEREKFEKKWSGIVDKVLIREMHGNINMTNTDSINHQNRFPCPHPFRRIIVDYEGQLKFCPIDWEMASRLPEKNYNRLAEAWHGDTYRKIRLAHLNNRFSEKTVCSECSDWVASPWKLGYEKVIKTLTN